MLGWLLVIVWVVNYRTHKIQHFLSIHIHKRKGPLKIEVTRPEETDRCLYDKEARAITHGNYYVCVQLGLVF